MRSKVAAVVIILLGVFLGMLTMEFRQELHITHSQKADEYVARTAALVLAWLIFYGVIRWAGSSHRRSAAIGRVCAIVWLGVSLMAIAIDNISYV